MAKHLLLSSLIFVLALAGSAASAEPLATDPPLAGVEQVEPAPVCMAQELDIFLELKPKPTVSICQGNPCDKTSDCRPVGVPECAQCWCIGPAGDKHCGCI